MLDDLFEAEGAMALLQQGKAATAAARASMTATPGTTDVAEVEEEQYEDDLLISEVVDESETKPVAQSSPTLKENTLSNKIEDLEMGVKELLLFDDVALNQGYGTEAQNFVRAVEVKLAQAAHHHT